MTARSLTTLTRTDTTDETKQNPQFFSVASFPVILREGKDLLVFGNASATADPSSLRSPG
jgi:hypothetical protein